MYQRLEVHWPLRLETRVVKSPDQRGSRVEDPAGGRGLGAVEAALPARPGQPLGIGAIVPVALTGPVQCGGTAPGLAPGPLAAGQPERPETRHASPIARRAQQGLATPERPVLAQADTVPGKHQPLPGPISLSRDGAGVRVMVPDLLHR